jgi:hypothetical protein
VEGVPEIDLDSFWRFVGFDSQFLLWKLTYYFANPLRTFGVFADPYHASRISILARRVLLAIIERGRKFAGQEMRQEMEQETEREQSR